jgi:hypothetical protein
MIRVLRVLEYKYDTVEAALADQQKWKPERYSPHKGLVISSSVVNTEVVDEPTIPDATMPDFDESNNHPNQMLTTMSTNNLTIFIQKMAKNISYYDPLFRRDLLCEAAIRLINYRQMERQQGPS